jgi:hypothetical protein
VKEVRGDLWVYPAEWRIITTNGTIRKDGCCVMGRGCAFEATQRFPMLAKELGQRIKRGGNVVHSFPQYGLLTFPVKHHWHDAADLDLIRQSTEDLKRYLSPHLRYSMPRAGCGNGRLCWADVKPILATLPDNVRVISFPNED